jgi:hypothetical protein
MRSDAAAPVAPATPADGLNTRGTRRPSARGSLRVTQYTDAPPMSADEVSALIRRATERAMGDMLNDAGEWL